MTLRELISCAVVWIIWIIGLKINLQANGTYGIVSLKYEVFMVESFFDPKKLFEVP